MQSSSKIKKKVEPTSTDLNQIYVLQIDPKKINDSIAFYNKLSGKYETGTPLHYFLLTNQFAEAKSLIEKYLSQIDLNSQNNTYKQTALHLAIERGNIEMVSFLISHHKIINVNLKSNNIAPLHLAIMARNLKIVKLLVEAGADIEQKMDASYLHPDDALVTAEEEEQIDQDTPLMIAVLLNNIEMTKILLDKGADVTKKYYDLTLLHLAIDVENINAEIVTLLIDKFIEKGLSIDTQDIIGRTPLSYSIEKSLSKITELLLKKGAKNINKPSNSELPAPPAKKSKQKPAKKNIKTINSYNQNNNNIMDPATFRSNGFTLLHLYAAQNKYTEELKELLEKNILDVNDQLNPYRMTPLYSAVSHNIVKTVELLLEQPGINVNLESSDGSPLYKAVCFQNLRIVILLIRHGADVNVVVKNLHLIFATIEHSTLEILQCLLDNKINIDVMTSLGLTPLGFAIQINKIDMAKLLIEKGANLEVGYLIPGKKLDEEASHQGCLQFAICQNKLEFVKLFLSKGASVSKKLADIHPLLGAVKIKGINFKIVEILVKTYIERKISLDEPDKEGRTALYFAIQENSPQIVKLLIDNNADINRFVQGISLLHLATTVNINMVEQLLNKNACIVQDKNGGTPLWLAKLINNEDILNRLEHYAGNKFSYDVLNSWNETYLHYVCKFNKLKKLKELFAKNNLNINAQDKNGITPLMCAMKSQCSVEIIELLLQRGASILITNKEYGNNALHLAALIKLDKYINLLLAQDTYAPFQYNKDNKTPIDLLDDIENDELRSKLQQCFITYTYTMIDNELNVIFKILSSLYNFTQSSWQKLADKSIEFSFEITMIEMEKSVFFYQLKQKIQNSILKDVVFVTQKSSTVTIGMPLQKHLAALKSIFNELKILFCTPSEKSEIKTLLSSDDIRPSTSRQSIRLNNNNNRIKKNKKHKKGKHDKNSSFISNTPTIFAITKSATNKVSQQSSEKKCDKDANLLSMHTELFKNLETSYFFPDLIFSASITYFICILNLKYKPNDVVYNKVDVYFLIKSFRFLAESIAECDIKKFMQDIVNEKTVGIEYHVAYEQFKAMYWKLKNQKKDSYLFNDITISTDEFQKTLKKNLYRLNQIKIQYDSLNHKENHTEQHFIAALLHEICVIGDFYSKLENDSVIVKPNGILEKCRKINSKFDLYPQFIEEKKLIDELIKLTTELLEKFVDIVLDADVNLAAAQNFAF